MITPDFEIARFLKLDPVMHAGAPDPNPVAGNETVGVVFSPNGDRMYFGAQRSFALAGQLPQGVVYEITGPFRDRAKGGGRGRGRLRRWRWRRRPRRRRSGGGAGGKGPEMRMRARKHKRINHFLRNGMPVRIEVDEPIGVSATLRTTGGAKRRAVTIGRGSTSVAVQGKTALRVHATEDAAGYLRDRDRVPARLTVTATDADGHRTVARRKVVLGRGD